MQTIMNSIEFYAEQTQNVSIKLEEYEKKANVFTYARLIVLLIAVPLAVFASYLSPYAIASVLVLGLIAFVYAVIQQQKFEGLSRRMRNLLSIIENEEACILHIASVLLHFGNVVFHHCSSLFIVHDCCLKHDLSP